MLSFRDYAMVFCFLYTDCNGTLQLTQLRKPSSDIVTYLRELW